MKLEIKMRKQGFELVKPAQDAHPGITYRLGDISGKSHQSFRAHGYESRTINPLSHGDKSPVDHLLQYVDQYEAAAPGAGKMLGSLIGVELRHRYETNALIGNDMDFAVWFHKEMSEGVSAMLAELNKMTANQLVVAERELREAEEAINEGLRRVRTVMALRRMPQGEVVN